MIERSARVTPAPARAHPPAGAPAAATWPPPLPRAFFERPTIRVARDLLGKLLVRRFADGDGGETVTMARIVEVEAYLGERDAASHARRGPTPRAAIMFGPPGHLYVYLIYGMHHCMNFVTERDGRAGAVLIRAAEPLAPAAGQGKARPLSGPGKLCRGLGITLGHKGLDLTAGGELYVADSGARATPRAASPRIGVDYAGEWAARALRFYVPGNPHVSGHPTGPASERVRPARPGPPARRARPAGGGPRRRST